MIFTLHNYETTPNSGHGLFLSPDHYTQISPLPVRSPIYRMPSKPFARAGRTYLRPQSARKQGPELPTFKYMSHNQYMPHNQYTPHSPKNYSIKFSTSSSLVPRKLLESTSIAKYSSSIRIIIRYFASLGPSLGTYLCNAFNS